MSKNKNLMTASHVYGSLLLNHC